MTVYYIVDPEVSGGWGKNTVFTRIPGKGTIVHRLHYQFDGWLGDHIVASSPCFIVTEYLADLIKGEHLTGAVFDEVEVTTSDLFKEIYPRKKLPVFKWLKVTGRPANDDFGITSSLALVVSERALSLLQRAGCAHAEISANIDED